MSDRDAEPMATSQRHGSAKARPNARTTVPVVGIGASAGGLEACQALLNSLSTDLGMAYVFVPHLDPVRESALCEILARATPMPVSEVEDGVQLVANHVYVIPRNCDMTIAKGALHITARHHPRPVITTIDTFLRSLAAERGNKAIGIVLSGTGSDGTQGLMAIKSQGGITFAQDSSAKYDGMPASAIASGSVDLVLPPEGITHELARIAGHPYVSGIIEPEALADTREAQMGQLFTILRHATRVDFSEYKPPTIGRRVARRMALHKIEKLADYVALLKDNHDELMALYQDLLINVTSFFRDAETFDALKRVVYPELLQDRERNMLPIRIWVPGCSTGEEPYSHAISLMEFLADVGAAIPVQIFGTDLSEGAIQRARSGIYKDTIETDVSPARLRRYFHHVEGGYQISKTIRDLCIFSTLNVFSDPPFLHIDLLSCRNVMIYLSQQLQRRVIPLFHYALNTGGFLMIGNTEGLLGSGPELFDMADKKHKIYRKNPIATPLPFGFSATMTEQHSDGYAAPGFVSKLPELPRLPMDLQRESDRLLLARYAPPSVVLNDNLEIVHTKGHTGPYLELPGGKASFNLLKMARPGLLFELQNAINEARKSGIDAVRPNVPVESDGGTKLVSLRVTPFKTPLQERTTFLVAFEPSDIATVTTSAEPLLSPLTEDERSLRDKQIAQLKQELAATKEYLQSIIETLESTNEELQSANEEIQSGNEELQSTNEELQTSKEELESANEELHTVNEEMHHRNEQLTQLNNDLSNLLNSVNLPMVMVGPDLCVHRFTPQASTVLGLNATDVGRPMARLRLKIEVDNLEQRMRDVISQARPAQLRAHNEEDGWYDLRLTPYGGSDGRSDGVVLTVLSFEELRGAEGAAAAGGPAVGSAPGARGKSAQRKTPARGATKSRGKK